MDCGGSGRGAGFSSAPFRQPGNLASIGARRTVGDIYRQRRRLSGDGIVGGTCASGRLHLTNIWRTFVFVGFLGGFTTFSSFGLDTFTMGHGGNHEAAAWNIIGQVTLGVGGVWLGYYLGL